MSGFALGLASSGSAKRRPIDMRRGSELAKPEPRLKLVAVLMRQTLDGLPDLVRLAHQWSMEELFVQHLCHDFAESSLPEEYRPMRDFVDAQTLLSEDVEHIEEVFAATQQVADELGIELRLPSPRSNPHPPGTPDPSAATGPGCGATSAIKVWRCLAARSPRPIGSTSVAWRSTE